MHKIIHQIHRDLKPDNILINTSGDIKLTDFGISKTMENTLALCATFVGTATYMSPERINGDDYSFPSDVWSMGIILYEMVTKTYPYRLDGSFVDLFMLIRDSAAPTLDETCGYSKSLQEFLLCW